MTISPDELDLLAVLHQAPVGWSVISLDGRQILGNAVYAELFGYSVDEMSELTVSELTHPDERSRTDEYLHELISGELDHYQTDKRYVRKDGSGFVGHLVASLLRDADGRPSALVGVITDVTEARAMAARVALSEERLSKMLTNISDTVSLVDATGAIQGTTGLHTEVLGYPRSFWEDKQIFDVVHPDDLARAEEMSARVLSTPGAELTDEFRIRHHSGSYEDVEMSAVNLLDDPAVGAVVITTRNITDRKANEREMARVRDKALALAEQRAGFVAHVSHELRTPLHAALGLTELLAESPLSNKQASLVDGLRREANRLRETVDDLLDYARVEADGISLDPVPTDVRDLVEGVIRRGSAAEHAAELLVEAFVAATVPEVALLDAHRVDQILTNLVGNAVKFTIQGHVHVTVATTPEDQIVFEVADTGPGIPADFRDSVFEPFTQVPGTSHAVRGSGLGLALVKALVDLMGGTITLRDTEGGGSTFRIALPLVIADRPVEQAAPVPEPARGDDPSIAAMVLVVEDNEVNQLLVRQQLERIGHRFHIVGTGTGGVDALRDADHGFDIVLMDWQLPDIDGIEATRQIRENEALHGGHVPVIAVTASAMPEDRAKSREAGMDDFLPKPVALGDLAAMIERWVPRTGSVEDDSASDAGEMSDAGAAAAEPDIEQDKLDGLVDDLGDRAIVESLVTTYLSELEERTETVAGAHQRRDYEVLHRLGHTLKSTSEMLGAMQFRDVCRRLETTDDDTDLESLMRTFDAAVTAARQGLTRWLNQEEDSA